MLRYRSPARILQLAAGLIAASLPMLAQAGEWARWYGDLAIGFDFAENLRLNDSDAKAEFDFGAPIGSVAIGRHLGDHWRLELEAGLRDNDLETLLWPDGDTAVRFDASDGVRATGVTLNAIRDFQIGALAPYLGVGLGPAELQHRMAEGRRGGTSPAPRDPIIDDESWSMALQLIAGFSVPVARRWDMAFDYRLWHAPSVELTGTGGESYDLEHTVHSGHAHLRYLFAGRRQSRSAAPSPATIGWYLGAGLGAGYAMDAEVDDSLENIDAFRVGPFYSLTMGKLISRRWRLELELAHRENLVEVIDFNPEVGQSSANGEVKTDSLMANLLYGFSPDKGVRPFLGFGAGVARLHYAITTQESPYVSGSATAPALQFLMGFDISLSRRASFRSDYRFWYAYPVELDRPDGSPFKTTHWVHSLTLGLHYSLQRQHN
jgi:opacity protein-like surface antigen